MGAPQRRRPCAILATVRTLGRLDDPWLATIPEHGFTHYWTMFNPRQLLVHAQLLRAIVALGDYDWAVREYVLGAIQQYLRNQNLFRFWHISKDCLRART